MRYLPKRFLSTEKKPGKEDKKSLKHKKRPRRAMRCCKKLDAKRT